MPCYDPRPDMDRQVQQEKIDKLTRLLCQACKLLEGDWGEGAIATASIVSTELKEWWKEHKAWDTQRRGQ